MYQYAHGGNAAFEPNGKKILDMSANINFLGLPNSVRKAVEQQINFLCEYPDCYNIELRKAVSRYENVSDDWIFCGNGASDIIFRIPSATRAKCALVLAPSFSDYERAVKAYGARVSYHTLTMQNGFKLDGTIIQTINQNKADLVFICNPNNPTGVLTEGAVLERLLEYCESRKITVVIDECFMDFVPQSENYTAKKYLNKYNNLIILKAFTKFFAMPGIRLGYALCSGLHVQKLYEHGADWAVSNLAQGAAIAALNEADEYSCKTVAAVLKEREFLQKELNALGFIVFDSKANFVFFYNPYDIDLYERLNKAMIRIRWCSNYNGLSERFYRTAVCEREKNSKLISALKEILEWQNGL